MKMINQESAESIPVSPAAAAGNRRISGASGLYDMNGATLLQDGVNFSAHPLRDRLRAAAV